MGQHLAFVVIIPAFVLDVVPSYVWYIAYVNMYRAAFLIRILYLSTYNR